MTQIVAFSKPAINVLTATDPDDFVFHSDYDTLKYEVQGTVTLNVNLANYYHLEPGSPPIFPDTYYNRAVVEVSHNLGYVPYFVGYILDIPSIGNAIQAPYAFGDFIYFANESVYADSNKLYFLVQFNSSSNSGIISFDYAYRIFKNDLGF
jgi:hypothetical protein